MAMGGCWTVPSCLCFFFAVASMRLNREYREKELDMISYTKLFCVFVEWYGEHGGQFENDAPSCLCDDQAYGVDQKLSTAVDRVVAWPLLWAGVLVANAHMLYNLLATTGGPPDPHCMGIEVAFVVIGFFFSFFLFALIMFQSIDDTGFVFPHREHCVDFIGACNDLCCSTGCCRCARLPRAMHIDRSTDHRSNAHSEQAARAVKGGGEGHSVPLFSDALRQLESRDRHGTQSSKQRPAVPASLMAARALWYSATRHADVPLGGAEIE
jgi:hypothetical protein